MRSEVTRDNSLKMLKAAYSQTELTKLQLGIGILYGNSRHPSVLAVSRLLLQARNQLNYPEDPRGGRRERHNDPS